MSSEVTRINPTKDQKILAECEARKEPFIVFRAKDALSTFVLSYYTELCEKMLAVDSEMSVQVVDRLNEFKAWQRDNPELVRFPD